MNSTLTKIFLASIEYHHHQEPSSPGKSIGGFVYCFIKAIDKKEAMKRLKRELNSYSREIIEVEFLEVYDPKTQWETSAETLKFKKLCERAGATDSIVFDAFYDYEKLD